MRPVMACLALAGCQLVFEYDGEAPPVAPVCAGRFGAQATELEIEQGQWFDPATSGDPDELWLTLQLPMHRDLMIARVDGGAIETPVPAAFNSTDSEFDATLTRDGRLVMFLLDGRIHEVTRDAAGAFGQVFGRQDFDRSVSGIDLSPSGLRIYYNDGDGVYVREREKLTDAFGEERELGFLGRFPSISPDELEIYYNHPDDANTLVRRTRPDVTMPFGDEESAFEGTGVLRGADAEVDATGEHLYFVDDNGATVKMLSRACE